MGSLIDRAVIGATLAAQPQLRTNLRTLVRTVTQDAFGEQELGAIERELVDSLTIADAIGMPSTAPLAGHALVLTQSQLGTVNSIVGRFRDAGLRARLAEEIASAVGAGRVKIR
nr:hypothetical protein [uncultured Sphingomonas sp.]